MRGFGDGQAVPPAQLVAVATCTGVAGFRRTDLAADRFTARGSSRNTQERDIDCLSPTKAAGDRAVSFTRYRLTGDTSISQTRGLPSGSTKRKGVISGAGIMRETYTRKLAERIDAVMFLMLIEAIAKRAILLLAASIETRTQIVKPCTSNRSWWFANRVTPLDNGLVASVSSSAEGPRSANYHGCWVGDLTSY